MNAPAGKPTLRTFISIPLKPELITELQRLQESLQAGLEKQLVRWTRPDQLHLTLKFLGNVAAEHVPLLSAALDRACQNTGPFQLSLQKLGCFPSPRKPSIIWVGIEGDLTALGHLQERIECETEPYSGHSEERDFRPHLTIGRVKGYGREVRPLAELLQKNSETKLGEWTVKEVKLMQSKLSPQGSTYSELANITLKSGKSVAGPEHPGK